MTPFARAAELAKLAGLLADGTRASFCLALLDGRAWTAGELADAVGVAPSTASEHLDRLLAGGLLTQRRQGRHRYVELAGPWVAELLEGLVSSLGPIEDRPRSLRAATASAALARGRTCYDHLAGRLGVGITDAMTARGLLSCEDDLRLTEDGREWLAEVVPDALGGRSRRPLSRACLDWTERRSHLAGVAGAALCARFRERGWIRPVGSGRAVRLTPAGAGAVGELLGVGPDETARW